jgi:hypothetical protein
VTIASDGLLTFASKLMENIDFSLEALATALGVLCLGGQQ